MLALHGGGRDGLEIHPNLWAGIGSHTEVAERIAEYHRLGIDEFVLSGYPHREEAYWFGEHVLPRLAAQGLWTRATRTDADAQPAALVPFAGSRTQR